MATLNQIAYDLLTIVRPHLSDDSDIEISQIKYWINNQRALWIRNEVNKKRAVDNDLIQTICAELEEVSASDCCEDIKCDTVMRMKKELPPTIELHMKEAIFRVAGINKLKKPFSYVDSIFNSPPVKASTCFVRPTPLSPRSGSDDGYTLCMTRVSAWAAHVSERAAAATMAKVFISFSSQSRSHHQRMIP